MVEYAHMESPLLYIDLRLGVVDSWYDSANQKPGADCPQTRVKRAENRQRGHLANAKVIFYR